MEFFHPRMAKNTRKRHKKVNILRKLIKLYIINTKRQNNTKNGKNLLIMLETTFGFHSNEYMPEVRKMIERWDDYETTRNINK